MIVIWAVEFIYDLSAVWKFGKMGLLLLIILGLFKGVVLRRCFDDKQA